MHGSSGGSFVKDFILGGVSGTVAKTASAPLERVKLLLQVQDMTKGDASAKYTGIMDCIQRVSSEQGIGSLWRGNVSNCVRYFPTQAINFASKERFQKFFVRHNRTQNFWKFFVEMLASGGAAGGTSLAFVYPLDFARTRLAADTGKGENREYTGLLDCCKKVYAKDGAKGLYRGFSVSLAGIIVYRATFFGVYDTFKAVSQDMFKGKAASKMKPVVNFAVGFTAETAAGVAAYPFDTIRRRLMMQSGSGELRYNGTFDCARKIMREEGVSAFYKGCFSNILRGVSGALVVVMYDELKKAGK